MNAEELLRRYGSRERDFRGIELAGADLAGAYLAAIDFRNPDLRKASLAHVNLSAACMTGWLLSAKPICETRSYQELTYRDS